MMPNFRFGSSLRALALGSWVLAAVAGRAASFYVDPARGEDAADGTTAAHPWRSLDRASRAPLHAGDRLALARGVVHPGALSFTGLAGTDAAPIVITSYAPTEADAAMPAVIDGRGTLAALHLKNCRHVHVEDLTLTADGGQPRGDMRCGVLVESAAAGEEGRDLALTRLVVKNVSYADRGFVRAAADVKTANGEGRYGWGIRFLVRAGAAGLRDLSVRDCVITRVDHTGLKFTAPVGGLHGVQVEDVRVTDVGGPGIQISGLQGGHFTRLTVDHSGSTSDSRNWGRGSGLWTWSTSDVVIEHSRFTNANGPGDSAGVHIDFRCRNVVVQYNLSAHNAGGFCEILGDNHNCAYRYNLSVNDGYRVKGRNGAFQEGKTFWLSGYVGNGRPPSGPFDSYFYNNTIYVGPDIEAKFSVAPTAAGVLVANNIFYVAGRSRRVTGDQVRNERAAAQPVARAVVSHNLFLRSDTPGVVARCFSPRGAASGAPRELALADPDSLIGDPAFVAAGGEALTDYIPGDRALVKNQGMEISALPGDPIGLTIGLQVPVDILGHPIKGRPDLGAIELP